MNLLLVFTSLSYFLVQDKKTSNGKIAFTMLRNEKTPNMLRNLERAIRYTCAHAHVIHELCYQNVDMLY